MRGIALLGSLLLFAPSLEASEERTTYTHQEMMAIGGTVTGLPPAEAINAMKEAGIFNDPTLPQSESRSTQRPSSDCRKTPKAPSHSEPLDLSERD